MPLKGTMGALAEFTQGYTTPLPVSNVSANALNPGLGGLITFTANTFVGAPETYVAISNTGNFIGNSVNNSIEVTPMTPFANYYFTVTATSAGGNSIGVNTNNVFIGCNVISNGNVTFVNASDFAINGNGTQISVLASGNRWLKYSRNMQNGQLTLTANINFGNGNSVSSIAYCKDDIYIAGSRITNNAPYGTFHTTTIWHFKADGTLVTIYGRGQTASSAFTNSINPTSIRCANPGNIIYLAAEFSATTAWAPYLMPFHRNESNGYLTPLVRTNIAAVTGANYSLSANISGDWQIPPDDGGAYALYQELGNVGNSDVLSFDRNGNTISYVAKYNVNSNLSLYYGLATSSDSNNIYAFSANNINVFSRNTTTSALTQIANISIANANYYNGVFGAYSNVLFCGGNNLFQRDTSGNLSLVGNSVSFTYPANTNYFTLISPDNKNIYTLQTNNVAIFNIYST